MNFDISRFYLTTNKGTNAVGAFTFMAMTTSDMVPESWRPYYHMFWGILICLALFLTKGHEALVPSMPHPPVSEDTYIEENEDEIDLTESISKVIKRASK